jgi:hypothetical protein
VALAAPSFRLLTAPPAEWSRWVAEDPDATPAHRAEVHEALVAVATSAERRYVVAERDGVAIGGAPAVIERRAGAHWLHALPHLLPAAPISSPGERADVDRLVCEGFAALQREARAAGGEWSLYRPSGAVSADALACVPGETRTVRAALLSLRPDEAIESRLDRDARHSYRRAQASGLAFAEEPEALEEVYALYVAQSRRWRGHRPLALELSRRLIAARGSNGSGPVARLFTARDGRRLLVGILVLEHPRERFWWWSGSHPAARGRLAFQWLMLRIAADAASRGIARLNLGGSAGLPGVEAFKRSLGARDVSYPVCWLDARFATWTGRALAALQSRLRRRRHRGDEPS